MKSWCGCPDSYLNTAQHFMILLFLLAGFLETVLKFLFDGLRWIFEAVLIVF